MPRACDSLLQQVCVHLCICQSVCLSVCLSFLLSESVYVWHASVSAPLQLAFGSMHMAATDVKCVTVTRFETTRDTPNI